MVYLGPSIKVSNRSFLCVMITLFIACCIDIVICSKNSHYPLINDLKLSSANDYKELSKIMQEVADNLSVDEPGNWEELMEIPETHGESGNKEIKKMGNEVEINQIVKEVASDANDEISTKLFDALNFLSFTESSTFQTEILTIISGETGVLSVVVLAGRKKENSDIREVAWAKFTTTASLKNQHETYIEYKDVRCGGIMNGWGKNCIRKIEHTRERGLKTDEIEIIGNKLKKDGFTWLRDQFQTSLSFTYFKTHNDTLKME